MTPEQWEVIAKYTSEFFYIVIALIFLSLGVKAYKQNTGWKRITTFLFWAIMAFIFAVGPYLPAWVTGLGVIISAVITGMKGVTQTEHQQPTPEELRRNADKVGYKVFIPALFIGLGAFAVARYLPGLGANNAIGVSAIIGLITAFIITKSGPKTAAQEGLRLMDNVGTVGILPQILAALGALFTAAGVGEVIAEYVAFIVPDNNILAGIIAYCVGMALFTMVMGNAFAAFAVITVGIGIPFLISNGGNPVIIGALGLTAGYCGTLLTPMAANFNILPAGLLEMEDEYGVIKAQAPYAIIMLIVHIALMYFFAF